MNKNFLICTNDRGQPILNKEGKILYYCTKTNAFTTLENVCETDTTANEFTHEITLKLLEIVQTKFDFLNDKMHSKKKIWSEIAREMQNSGYLANCNRIKLADKCHQRWRNLQKMYHGHCRYMKSTGTGKKKQPKYFDEMHELIGEKHSSQPVNLLDSLDDCTTSATSGTCTDETKSIEGTDINKDTQSNSSEKENIKISNIFENVKKSVKPKKDNLSVFKELHAQDIQIENERFDKLQALLVEQNELKKRTIEQRDEFLNVMKTFINLETHKKSKKKKY
ncbi:uncharacterized protein LOC109862228 isoform X2 [Pseudomyrmex gracilis]|uniref:uncharacterized protein LOC109862228 isoform X2 n=1 Tax=Pseudomyrmex gracilis TaxID=219809 RepID=UPI0009953C8C|nr:uncharacterized protein LOC109862228 isoform X2 [Pseudomyrmex gracilis]